MVAHLLTRRARWWVLLALAGGACLTPTDPNAGRVAELRLRAAFAPGADPDAMGVTVDSAAVTATPTDGGPTAVDTVVPLPDLEATLSWIVNLETDSAPYAVRLDLRGGERRLYSGTAEVRLDRLPLGEAPVHDVPVAYVGPGAVASVTVTPGAVTLTAAGAVQSFTAEARDADGTLLAPAFTWTTSDTDVATVDAGTGEATAVTTGTATITATASGVSGTATLTVALGGLFVEIEPARATLPALGASQPFTATARDGDGAAVEGATFTWTSGNVAVVTVDAAGLATAVAEGVTTVSAETGGVTATADVRVAVVTTVQVSPTSATLTALGDVQAFSATARDGDGDPVPDVAFTWTSANPAAATVDPASGLATAVANGSTIITATAGSAAGTATLDVAQAIASFAVTPVSVTLTAVGATQAFAVTAEDANGYAVDVDAVWSSADPAVATVDPATGLATAVATGETRITATADTLSADARLVVAPGGLGVDVTPERATIVTLGGSRQFTAAARDGNGTPIANATFEWTARNPAVISVDDTGLVTALTEGTSWVIATLADAADSAEVIVAVATTVDVTPATATLEALGAVQAFTALARDVNGTEIPDVTFTWSSSDPGVASVDPVSGVATALANGDVTITARAGDAAGTASLTVRQAVAAVAVSPGSATLDAFGATQQFVATPLDANANPVTRPVTVAWSSTGPTVAAVDGASGLATAVGNGTAGILAAAEGATGGASLTVDQVVRSVSVTPPSATLTAIGATVDFDATGRDANGYVVADALFGWTSDDSSVGTVDPTSGLATAVGQGSATITASADGALGTAALLVDLGADPARTTITADPIEVEANNDNPSIITVRLFDGDGNPLGRSDGTVVLVTTLGDLTAVTDLGDGTYRAELRSGTAGTAVVTGTLDGVAIPDDAQVLFVDVNAVATIEVTPAADTLEAFGSTRQFTAVARNYYGDVLTGVSFAWSSANDGVASVDATTGIATAVGNGTATITAAADGVTGSGTLMVAQVVAAVTVAPADATLTAVGETVQLVAEARDANGYLVADAAFVWSTSDSAIATVSTAGLVTAVANGHAEIRAASGTAEGLASVTVCVASGTAGATERISSAIGC